MEHVGSPGVAYASNGKEHGSDGEKEHKGAPDGDNKDQGRPEQISQRMKGTGRIRGARRQRWKI